MHSLVAVQKKDCLLPLEDFKLLELFEYIVANSNVFPIIKDARCTGSHL